jgi:hypothetical protein
MTGTSNTGEFSFPAVFGKYSTYSFASRLPVQEFFGKKQTSLQFCSHLHCYLKISVQCKEKSYGIALKADD